MNDQRAVRARLSGAVRSGNGSYSCTVRALGIRTGPCKASNRTCTGHDVARLHKIAGSDGIGIASCSGRIVNDTDVQHAIGRTTSFVGHYHRKIVKCGVS